MSSPLAHLNDLNIGRLRIKPAACEVVRGAEAWVIEPQVMRVLALLGARPGQVVSRGEMVDACWDSRAISEDAINRVLSRLRQLGRDTGEFHIRTVRKVGYRLEILAPVAMPQETPEKMTEAEPPKPTPDRPHWRRLWLYGAGGVLALLLGLAIWWAASQHLFVQNGFSLAITDIRADTPAALPPERLRSALAHTLSQMRGLKLVAPSNGGAEADYSLSGYIGGTPAVPVIELTLSDTRSHTQVWSARFDQALMTDPSASDRAVAATARYLAVVLGERVAGPKSAGDPPPAEVATRISEGQRALSQAHEARHNRDWPRFERLMAEVDAAATRALAVDPQSAGALMLKYEVDALPLYPRSGESQTQFADRQQRALSYLTRAVTADPDNPDVLAAAGRDMMDRQRWDDSERLLVRAVAIDPNSRDGTLWYSYYLGLMNRCGEGLKLARLAAALAPDDIWRQLAVPRLMHCAGRKAEAARIYTRLIDQDRGNVFAVREYYLMLLAQEDPKALRQLSHHIRHDLWRDGPTGGVADFLHRIDLAADALDGRAAAFHAILDGEMTVLDTPKLASDGFGKSYGDRLFVLGVEYGHTGQADKAIACLSRAVEQSSLYLPWALPYGASPMPRDVTRRAEYRSIWRRSPQIVALIKRRKGSGWGW
ncbi:winged helix-turn-helix domain-containing protein [Asticcacaulis sp. 201]|uniref:winged helix-turn-helix domain-containing protein n=1 Tax=Asticcacaulis sp. 201 TaxID=3028787 RepID=UPI002916E3FE|nr:winged helix-turn-helix domain-containing protein [Asticcacaulis sp. 201]MDV6329939.1 winged helix-turn-helix domain-containing protein [Asticcacaulis sp. 201]